MEESYFNSSDIISMTFNKSGDGTFSVNIVTNNNGKERDYFIPKLQLYPKSVLVKHDKVSEQGRGMLYAYYHDVITNLDLSGIVLAVSMKERDDAYYFKVTEYDKA
jgi:hypothetical protein